MSAEPKHDVSDGWCRCGQLHGKAALAGKAPGRRSRSDLFPAALPCGRRVKNRQGKWIGGPYAPTRKVAPDGTRVCRCGRRWTPEIRWVERKAD